MPDTDSSPNLGLPFYQTKLNEFEVQHNEALLMLDALVMLAVIDRDLSAPPASPAVGDRYLVKATGIGAFAGNDNRIAQYDIGGWNFYAPHVGWTCYVQDEHALLAWNGTVWEAALDPLGGVTELQNLSLLGVGTTADGSNPLSAKLNNVLWVAKTVAEGGDGTLRYKLSKENAGATLSLLFQDNFSGRAEIGLAGDDDFHFKTSPDGSAWIDALTLDKTTGATKLNSALLLTGDISPSQITADQNDYNPAGLSQASVLRLSTDASRNITGLAGGADGRVAAIINVGTNPIVLKDASASSSATNRFSFGADVTLAAKQSAVLWYDAVDSRWKLVAGPQSAGSVSTEAIQDAVGGFTSGVRGVKVIYDDAGDALTIEKDLVGVTITLTAQAYTTQASDLGKVGLVTTGASDASITMMSPATAGDGKEQALKKIDGAAGLCKVYQNDGTTLIDIAAAQNDTIFLRSTGSTWVVTHAFRGNLGRNKFDASAAPAATDDANKGFRVGSLWLRSDTGEMWRCRDATASAAKWNALDSFDHPGYISGNWYQGAFPATLSSNTGYDNKIVFMPFVPKARMTIDQLAARVSSAQAGSHFQLAVYDSNATTKRPTGAPLGYTASISGASAAAVSASLNTNVQLEPGHFYYLAVNSDNASLGLTSFGTAHSSLGWLFGSATLGNLLSGNAQEYQLRVASTTYVDATPTSSFPDVTSSTFTEAAGASMPNICFHITSIP